MAGSAAATDLQSEAFRRLYPEEFYAKFIAEGVRPDGRPLGRPRPVSIGLGSIGTADASAHVKVWVFRRLVAA
jgi:exosome complex component RRP43